MHSEMNASLSLGFRHMRNYTACENTYRGKRLTFKRDSPLIVVGLAYLGYCFALSPSGQKN